MNEIAHSQFSVILSLPEGTSKLRSYLMHGGITRGRTPSNWSTILGPFGFLLFSCCVWDLGLFFEAVCGPLCLDVIRSHLPLVCIPSLLGSREGSSPTAPFPRLVSASSQHTPHLLSCTALPLLLQNILSTLTNHILPL